MRTWACAFLMLGACGVKGRSHADSAPEPEDASAMPGRDAAGPDAGAARDSAAPDTTTMAADAQVADAHAADADATGSGGYELVWSDEFDGADGAPPDFTGKWTADLGWGEGGWGNNELQYYTAQPENIVQRGGNLVISARRDNAAGKTCGGKACQFTSARIHTKGKFEQMYGRFEARLKVPSGSPMWPAFWMMGNDFPTPSDWPFCGEIDVMEIWGYAPGTSAGTTHDPGNGRDTVYQDTGLSGAYHLPAGGKFADAFHTFAIEWEADAIRFFVDGHAYHCVATATAPADHCGTVPPTRLPAQGKWVFDHPFFMLLDLAVDSEATPDPPGTLYPRDLLVDYVRVYRKR